MWLMRCRPVDVEHCEEDRVVGQLGGCLVVLERLVHRDVSSDHEHETGHVLGGSLPWVTQLVTEFGFSAVGKVLHDGGGQPVCDMPRRAWSGHSIVEYLDVVELPKRFCLLRASSRLTCKSPVVKGYDTVLDCVLLGLHIEAVRRDNCVLIREISETVLAEDNKGKAIKYI